MRTAQTQDDDLRVLYDSLTNVDRERPKWQDVAHHGEGCKFYLNEWCRLRVVEGLLYRLWESPDGLG